jgi:hypothetical protein
LQTALKIVQLRRRELEFRPLIGFQYLPSTVPVDDAFDVLNDRIWCLLRLPFLPLLGWREGRSVREGACSRGSCSRRDVVVRWCIRRNVVRRLGVHRSNSYDYAHTCTTIQASALLACVGEQCLTAAPTNAVQFPRYPSIAIPTRRSPEFASSFSTDRAGPHETHREIWWACVYCPC